MRNYYPVLVILAILLAACQPSAAGRNGTVPFAWPLSPLTQAEKDQIAQCNIRQLVKDRYSNASDEASITSAYTPANPCDWAVQANAYLETLDDASTSENARKAYLNAVQNNPGFALAILGFPQNYGIETLVQPPPFASEGITLLDIQYSWGGLGTSVKYHITIDNTGASPKITVLEGDETLTARSDWKLNPETLNAIGPSLKDLIPIQAASFFSACTDNSPSWLVEATFAGGKKLQLSSNWNLFTFGGPWKVMIDNQLYLQDSSALPIAIYSIIKELDLPVGEPMGMYCNVTNWIYDHITP